MINLVTVSLGKLASFDNIRAASMVVKIVKRIKSERHDLG